ncbi:cupin domain-containing protein [Rhodoferax sp.]|uniref:cupin domain-containing protein n=1 Tax=Rhodoferax sp. TaxID=50421 RepID=UPI0025D10132|nr:cupin domain-containing protein [Rhodoferax sp.]
MQRQEFTDTLALEGFETLVTVTREPHGSMDEHTHAFEAKALVLKGALTITAAGVEQAYAVGEVFHLPAILPHSERYGPLGVEYLVGRK